MIPGASSHRWIDSSTIIAALENHGYTVQARSDGQWQAQCPAHDDRSPSLSISPEGKIYCFAGCDTNDVLDALGLRNGQSDRIAPRPLSNVSPSREAKKPSAETLSSLKTWSEICANSYADSIAEDYVSRRWGLTRSDAKALGLGFDEGLKDSRRPACLKGLYGCPRLIIPLRDTKGDTVSLQGRALEASTFARWAGPSGSGWPSAGAMGLQQDGPVLITEGPGDAIAAWTTGIPVIAITGAARTRQATGLIRQWCPDRRFIAAGDADEAGAKFVQALVKQLGASILSLPGDIKDISDWMKKSGESFASELREAIDSAAVPGNEYDTNVAPITIALGVPSQAAMRRRSGEWMATDDGLWKISGDPDVPPRRLTTTDLEITEVRRIDDGAEERVVYCVAVRHSGRERVVTVTPEAIERPVTWIASSGLVGATVMPGCGSAALAACQVLSTGAPERNIFGHFGWRRIGGELAYLHAGGAINAKGTVPGIEVEVGEPLTQFILPDPPSGARLSHVVRRALALCDLGDPMVTVPSVTAAWRAALGDPGWSVALVGQTGARKSTLAALIQAFWVSSSRYDRLPSSFASTANSIAETQFRAADTVLVVDEYVPQPGEESRAQSSADRVIRGSANHAGRQRLRPDGTPRTVRPPRCLTLVTGEALPDGESLRARMLTVRMDTNSLPINDALSSAQHDAESGTYAEAMSAWIQHLASIDPSKLREAWGNTTSIDSGHPRIDTMLHEVVCTWREVLSWAVEIGAITKEEYAQRIDTLNTVISQLIREQQKELIDAAPWRRFLNLLTSALATGRVRLAAPGEIAQRSEPPIIGWTIDGQVFLEPNTALGAVLALAREEGRPMSASMRLITDGLRAAGVLVSSDADHATVRKVIDGRRVRVLAIDAEHIGISAVNLDAQAENPELEIGLGEG